MEVIFEVGKNLMVDYKIVKIFIFVIVDMLNFKGVELVNVNIVDDKKLILILINEGDLKFNKGIINVIVKIMNVVSGLVKFDVNNFLVNGIFEELMMS